MAMFEEVSRRKKIIRVNHAEPHDFRLNYILLPVGYSYNSNVRKAKKGDLLRLWNGGDHRIYSVRLLKAESAEADILCRMRYGITMKGAMQRWKSNAKLEGHGERAVSEEQCLWVIYEIQDQD